jgi:putative flippase GtrA
MIKRTMPIFMLMSRKFLIMINIIIMLLYLPIMIHMLCLHEAPHMFMIGVGLGAIILFLVHLGKFTLVQLLCIKHVILLLYFHAKMPK